MGFIIFSEIVFSHDARMAMKKVLLSLLSFPISLLLSTYSNLGMASTYSYIANANNNSITLCTDAGVEGLDDCSDSGASGFDNPIGIAVPDVAFSDIYYAYITNAGSDSILQCEIDTDTGELASECFEISNPIFSNPFSIAFESADATLYAFITASSGSDVIKCTVDSSAGTFSSCASAASTIFENPSAVTLQEIGEIPYAFIPDRYTALVKKCLLNESTGSLVNCFDSGVGAVFGSEDSGPIDVAFSTSDSLYGYVLSVTGDVNQCDLNIDTGEFTSCSVIYESLIEPTAINFVTLGSDLQYVYLVSSNLGNYSVCLVDDADGSFTSCSTFTVPIADLDSTGITAYTVNGVNYVYVANADLGTVSQCIVYAERSYTYCLDSGVGEKFDMPVSLNFYQFSSESIYAFVVDITSSTAPTGIVWSCEVDPITGQFSNCTRQGGFTDTNDSILPTIFERPHSVALGIVDVETYAYPYAYVSDQGTDSVWLCLLSLVGHLYSCDDASDRVYTFDTPTGISLQVIDDVNYLYIVSAGTSSVNKCELNNDGTFDTCSVITGYSTPSDPNAINFDQTEYGLIAYVAGSGQVKSYFLDTSGDFTYSYTNTVSGLGSNPGMAISPWIFNTSGSVVSKVFFAKGEFLIGCETTGGTSVIDCATINNEVFANDIAFQTVDSNVVAYLTIEGAGSAILACDLDEEDASLALCLGTAGTLDSLIPRGIAFQEIESNNYVYITDAGSSNISVCLSDSSSGLLSNCVTESLPGVVSPKLLGLGTIEDNIYAYMPHQSSSFVSKCEINLSNGLPDPYSCVDTASVFDAPIGLAFNNDIAYVTEGIKNRVVVCDLGSSNFFESCADSGVNAIFAEPAGITFATDGDDNVNAYITNAQSGDGDCDPPNNSVSICSVNSETGLFTACDDSRVGSIFDEPTGIAFGSSYAYLSNSDLGNNSVFRCSINPDGTFDLCGDSGVGTSYFNQPIGIAFFTP